MLEKNNKLILAPLLLLYSVPSVAAEIVFGPVSATATAIPTLSGSMLVVLSLFLVFIAYKVLKQRTQHNAALWLALIGISVILSATSSFRIVDSADASPGTPIVPNTPLVLDPNNFNIYWNNTPDPLRVISITLDACVPPVTPSLCAVGTIVLPNETCEVNCGPP